VALDNDLITWENFHNQYWPAHYLIDKNGMVVYQHFGESGFNTTEDNIRTLLGLKEETSEAMPSHVSPLQTPETYLGYNRAQTFASPEPVNRNNAENYSFPSILPTHYWALQGNWRIGPEGITAEKAKTALRFNFVSRKVFMVLGSAGGNPLHIHVFLNGQPVGKAAGADVKDEVLTVDGERLYELVDQRDVKAGILDLQIEGPGMQAYAFTFGM
jgi:hypothetical protein